MISISFKRVSLIIAFLLIPIATFAALGDWSANLNQSANQDKGMYDSLSSDKSTVQIIATYIGGLLMLLAPLLGIIFFGIVVFSGYQWMTAAGNLERIEAAQTRIKNAAIGILVFSILYLLAYFIISRLGGLTGYKII